MVHVTLLLLIKYCDFEKINILEYAFGEGGGGNQKAYAVYAFINVDNCERPLTQVVLRAITVTFTQVKKVSRLNFDARHCDNIAFVVSLSCNITLKIRPSSANALLGQRLKNVWSLHFEIAGDFTMALCHLYMND